MKRILLSVVAAAGIMALSGLSFADNGSISGKVYEKETGTALSGVEVFATNQITYQQTGPIYTGPDGVYLFSDLAPSQYEIHAKKANYGTDALDGIVLSSGETLLNQNLYMTNNPGRIYGVVRDDGGNVMSDVYMDVGRQRANGWTWTANTTTNASGYFEVTDLNAADYVITTKQFTRGPVNYGQTTVSNISVQEGLGTEINPIVYPAAKVYGKITDAITGLPIQNVDVNAYAQDGGIWGGNDTTDANGDYELPFVKPGLTYTINCKPPYNPSGNNYAIKRVAQEVSSAGDYLLNIQLEPGAIKISGHVTDNLTGLPVSDISVSYDNFSTSNPGVWQNSSTDINGDYLLTNLPKGDARIYARTSGTYASESFYKDFQSDDVVNFQLDPESTVSGVVKDFDTGLPIQGMTVYFENELQRIWWTIGVTDSNGAFSLGCLPEGIARLSVRPEINSGYAWADKYVYLATGEHETNVEILVRKGALVTVRTKNAMPPNEPLANIEVLAGGLPRTMADGHTDANGEISFRLAPATHEIGLGNDEENVWSSLSVAFTVSDANDNKEIELLCYNQNDSAHITGNVLNESVYPKTSFFMVAAFKSGTPVTGETIHHMTMVGIQMITGDSGPYDLMVPPGNLYDVYLCIGDGFYTGPVVATTARTGLHFVPSGASGQDLNYDSVGGTVTGTVTSSGIPVVMASVVLTKADGGLVAWCTADGNGVYHMYNVPSPAPGESYLVFAYDEGLGRSENYVISEVPDGGMVTKNIYFMARSMLLWNNFDSDDAVSASEVGPNGTIAGQLNYSPCKFGNGALNADSTSYVTFDNSAFSPDRGTIEFWFKTDFDVVDGRCQTPDMERNWIWQQGDNAYLLVFFNSSTYGSPFHVWLAGASATAAINEPPVSWRAGELHHFALSYDRNGIEGAKGKTMALYLDGVEAGSSSVDWGMYNKGAGPLYLLNRINKWNMSHTTIDNVKVWNYAKTDFSDRYCEGNLILWNKLGSQDEVTDSMIGPNGNIFGEIEYLSAKFGDGFRSLPRPDRQTPDNFIDYKMQLGHQGSIEFWYQPDWSDLSVNHMIYLFTYGKSSDPAGFRLGMGYNDWQNTFHVSIFDADDPSQYVQARFSPFPPSGWTTQEPFHIAVSWDDTLPVENRIAMYVNGVKVPQTVAFNGDPKLESPEPLDFYLGSKMAPGEGYHQWEGNTDGVIDNIKIWDYAKANFPDRFFEGFPVPSNVRGRYIFYNNSAFDGNNTQADLQDESAIAIDKEALLPGQTATFANYTSCSKGINGIMVDIENLNDPADLNIANISNYFSFNVGNDNSPQNWPAAPLPSTVGLRQIDDSTYRVTLIWNDGAVTKEWLKVKVLANEYTGLVQENVFYFGNAIGETGNSATDAKVNAFDMLGARDNPRSFLNPAPIDFAYDFNRDKRVNAIDMLIARDNPTSFLNALKLITASE